MVHVCDVLHVSDVVVIYFDVFYLKQLQYAATVQGNQWVWCYPGKHTYLSVRCFLRDRRVTQADHRAPVHCVCRSVWGFSSCFVMWRCRHWSQATHDLDAYMSCWRHHSRVMWSIVVTAWCFRSAGLVLGCTTLLYTWWWRTRTPTCWSCWCHSITWRNTWSRPVCLTFLWQWTSCWKQCQMHVAGTQFLKNFLSCGNVSSCSTKGAHHSDVFILIWGFVHSTSNAW